MQLVRPPKQSIVAFTHLATLLQQNLIVFTQRHTEDDRGHVLEAVNPLLALTSLATDIKHASNICETLRQLIPGDLYLLNTQLAHLEPSLVNTGGLGSGS